MRPRGRRRIFRGFFGTTVMAVVSLSLVAYEWDFRRTRVAGEAVVTEHSSPGGRTGLMIADAIHRVGGTPIQATLRTFYLRFQPGERVAVLYLKDDPTSVVADLFWQRHYGSAMALAACATFATFETMNVLSLRRRRRSSLLGHDLAGDSDASEILRRLRESLPR